MTMDGTTLTVAHLCDDLRLGGWSSLVATLPELPKHGIRPLVFTLFGEGEYAAPLAGAGIPVCCLHLRRSNLPWCVARLARRLRRARVDIVHTHLPVSHLIGLTAARLAGVQAQILHVHTADDAPGPVSRWWLRRLVRGIPQIVAVSRAALTAFAARHPDCLAAVSVVPNGIDVESVRARRRASTLHKANFGIPGEAFTVLVAANFKPEKGHRLLIEATARPAGDGVHLLLAGDGTERPACEALARQLGMADRCHFLGPRPDVPELLAVADVLTLPSTTEQFGICLLEAFAAGVPVVATRVGGIPEVARDGIDALLVPPGDAAALAAAICELRNSPEQRAELIANAASRVMAFTHAAAAERLAAVYREMLGAR